MRYTSFFILLISIFLFSLTKPATAQVMLGAYVPGDGWDIEEITRFNEASAKPLAFVTFFSAFSHNWQEHLKWQTSNIYNTGAVPLISWMPVDINDSERNLLPEITAGKWDTYIDRWIEGFMAWVASYPASKRPIVLLRFGHEFNGNWYPYSGEPDQFIQAWQYLHQRFQSAGANDFIEWVWNANHISYDDQNDITKYYPGNRYVDWTALDGYNWGTNHEWTEWDSFAQIFASAYDTLISNYPDKPILIAEYGTTEPSDTPSRSWGQSGNNSDHTEDRSIWFQEMLISIEQYFPAIRGIGLFSRNKELSWSLTSSSSTGLDGFNIGIQSDHYTTSFLCARVMPGTSSRLPSIESNQLQIGRISVVPRELIDPVVFEHAINTRKPPKHVINKAISKSSHYRSEARLISRGQRTTIAKKRLESLNY